MTRSEQIQLNREDIIRLAKRYGVTEMRIFGSVAHGEDNWLGERLICGVKLRMPLPTPARTTIQ